MRTVNDFPDIDPSDLVDSVNTQQPARFSKWALGAAFALGIPLVAFALVLGSLPEMSPAEIVQMEGYAGRAQASSGQEVAQASEQAALQEVEIEGFELAPADPVEPVVSAVVEDSSFREIAAATQAVEKSLNAAVTAPDTENYPVLQVKKQYSNVRSGPSTGDSIITSLEVGSTVTVFNRSGNWLQVGLNDGSAVTGYIHKSLLGIVSPGAN